MRAVCSVLDAFHFKVQPNGEAVAVAAEDEAMTEVNNLGVEDSLEDADAEHVSQTAAPNQSSAEDLQRKEAADISGMLQKRVLPGLHAALVRPFT